MEYSSAQIACVCNIKYYCISQWRSMILPVDKRYKIVFFVQHPMGPQLGEKAVANAVK